MYWDVLIFAEVDTHTHMLFKDLLLHRSILLVSVLLVSEISILLIGGHTKCRVYHHLHLLIATVSTFATPAISAALAVSTAFAISTVASFPTFSLAASTVTTVLLTVRVYLLRVRVIVAV